MKLLGGCRGAESLEAAATIPVVAMLVFFLVQGGILVYNAQICQEAARHGARMGSVAQVNPAAVAYAEASAYASRLMGSPSVTILAPGGVVGSELTVRVETDVPNVMGHLVPGMPSSIHVSGEATFRQEGW